MNMGTFYRIHSIKLDQAPAAAARPAGKRREAVKPLRARAAKKR